MNAYAEQTENKIVIKASGRIDSVTCEDFRTVISELAFGEKSIIFDFADVEYISSAGLRILLMARKKSVLGNMQIINVPENIYEIFCVTGFVSMIDISKKAKKAVKIAEMCSFKSLIEEKAKKEPDFEIISFDGQQYTWAELDKCAQILANDLYKKGVHKGTHVGICGANSANIVLAFFAVQKLGGIACMMNFGYTVKELLAAAKAGDITHLCVGEMSAIEDEKDIMLAATKEECTITDCINISNSVNFKSRLAEYHLVIGMFKDDFEVDDACLMIYTSGSTGVPKGVLLSAYNILSAAESMANVIHISPEDRFCLVLPIFHIFGFTGGLFSVIAGGGQIHIAKSTRSADVISTLKNKKCTLIYSVPSLILAIINNPEFKAEDFSDLRSIMVGGAPTTEAQAEKMKKALPGVRFINAYGLSEMTPISLSSYDEDYGDFYKTSGKPIDIINVKVIDTATGEECKKGQTGEICVDGTNLMTCYYKQDISSQSIDENGWLRTGDLGCFDDKGRLCIKGRIKEIIIRGGENIMPDEIASAISEFEDVVDVKVVGVPHSFFGEAACAVVVMKNGKLLDEEKLKSFLAKKLSKQKIPDYFLVYEKLPTLSNGKTDTVTLKNEAAKAVKETEKK